MVEPRSRGTLELPLLVKLKACVFFICLSAGLNESHPFP